MDRADEQTEDATPFDADAEALERAEACATEVAKVCARHNCDLRAFLQEPDPVGRDGSCVQLTAAYGFFPRKMPQ